jgi:hypothetical protein
MAKADLGKLGGRSVREVVINLTQAKIFKVPEESFISRTGLLGWFLK